MDGQIDIQMVLHAVIQLVILVCVFFKRAYKRYKSYGVHKVSALKSVQTKHHI